MPKKLSDFVTEARSAIREITPDDLEEMKAAAGDLLIVDVREPDEYQAGHIEGAINVPRGTLEGAADPDYHKRHETLCRAHDRPVVLYCESGGRSAMATRTLSEMGFSDVRNLAGGVKTWEAEDFPLVND